jgi:NAD-dependent deacetylase
MPDALREALRRATRIVALTGAGMSAESGVPTFRDAMHGLWARFDPSQLATPAAWRADRETVWAWYEWRRVLVGRAQPHAGHRALASLARVRPEGAVRIATQNVDDLHERAGSSDVVHVHGSLFAPRCDTCGRPGLFAGDPPVGADGEPVARLAPPRCAHCAGGHLRPGVVWFDEPLPPAAWAASVTLCEQADLVLVVGTSGLVQPAARLPRIARDAGAFVAEINPVASEVSGDAHACWRVGAAAGLEALVRDA